MCGIVGLFLKTPKYEARLGELTTAMLKTMSDRGPDSAGFAVYGAPAEGLKLTLRGPDAATVASALKALKERFGRDFQTTARDTHAVVTIPTERESAVRDWVGQNAPGVDVVSSGHSMEIYKEVGLPPKVAQRFDLPAMSGTHAIGHTRMATESAVTTNGAHPFSTGGDQCLVHNGSLSNHNGLRRMLEKEGVTFKTQNDTEVAAGYLSWRMREGDTLGEALEKSLDDLDGFFTFVVGTANSFGVVRDPIACKPAVMAETEDYVAFGSEFRALVGLPDIEDANIFEPEPAHVYFWERN